MPCNGLILVNVLIRSEETRFDKHQGYWVILLK